MKEAYVLAQVRDYLRARGVFFFRVHQSLGSSPGISDLIAIQPGSGRLVALELKGDKGQLSQFQGNFIENVKQAGGLGGVVRCIEDVAALIFGEIKA